VQAKKFGHFLKEQEEMLMESKKSKKPGTATLFEKYIVNAWNNLVDDNTEVAFTDPEFSDKKHQAYAPAAYKIAADMRKTLKVSKTTKMVHSGSDTVRTSKEYIGFGGPAITNKPKADIRTSDNKYRLSMKKDGRSQLISGRKTDTFPVFKLAEMSYANTDDAVLRFGSAIDDIMSKIEVPKSIKETNINTKHMSTTKSDVEKGLVGIMDATKNIKEYPKDVQNFLNQIMFVDSKMKTKLTDVIGDVFNTSSVFKKHFVYEAASGAGKFADKQAIANGFLVFNKSKVDKGYHHMNWYMFKIDNQVSIFRNMLNR